MEIKKDYSIGIVPLNIDSNGNLKVCLILHSLGHWSFPKGHPDSGEGDEETALRELKEETGISNITLGNKTFEEKYSFDWDGERYDKTVKYFFGYTSETDTKIPYDFEEEVKEIRWLPFKEALELCNYPETKKLLKQVQEHISKS